MKDSMGLVLAVVAAGVLSFHIGSQRSAPPSQDLLVELSKKALENQALMSDILRLEYRVKVLETKFRTIAPTLRIHYSGYYPGGAPDGAEDVDESETKEEE